MAAPAPVIAPPCCVPGSHAAVAFPAAPAHAPQFRETGGCLSRRPLHTHPLCRLGSLLFFYIWGLRKGAADKAAV
jgi:hypothetical protein